MEHAAVVAGGVDHGLLEGAGAPAAPAAAVGDPALGAVDLAGACHLAPEAAAAGRVAGGGRPRPEVAAHAVALHLEHADVVVHAPDGPVGRAAARSGEVD